MGVSKLSHPLITNFDHEGSTCENQCTVWHSFVEPRVALATDESDTRVPFDGMKPIALNQRFKPTMIVEESRKARARNTRFQQRPATQVRLVTIAQTIITLARR
jgi:hypothetical protein